MQLQHERRGSGRPLLLVHGLGSSWRSWTPILDSLAEECEAIAIDLPGFGETPPLPERPTIAALADAVGGFQRAHGLEDCDLVGSSMGARLVLELARRGSPGAVVALDPGGFWNDRERRYFQVTLNASIRLVRALEPVLPHLTANPLARALLLAQFSARPRQLPPELALLELRSFARSEAFDPVLHELVHGPTQPGAPSTPGPVTIGWGRKDRVCFPAQAGRAQARFPQARLHWFDDCGHFPHWDAPAQTIELILTATRSRFDPGVTRRDASA